MNLIPDEIMAYIERLTPSEPEILKKLDRETNLNVPYPNMLTGHVQGRFLAFLSKLIRPKLILEVGTYTGYSAICLAEGLHEGGHIHTIDVNPELEDMANRYFREAGLEDVITLHLGNALEIIPGLDGIFDLIYLDADKENYPEYLGILKGKLGPNGLLLIDNTLWSGKVLEKSLSGDQETQGIQKFNKMVSQDPSLDSLILPMRDGLTMIRKKY